MGVETIDEGRHQDHVLHRSHLGRP